MKNKLSLFIVGVISLVIFSSCGYERINAGHVGIKVNLYGDDKGVDDIVEVTGAQWYNPIKTEIYETPTFVQNVVWTEDKRDDSRNAEGFTLTTKDGMTVGIDVSLNYRVEAENAVPIFKKYREPLHKVANTVLRNYTRDGYNQAASYFTAEELYSNRALFEDMADSLVTNILKQEGFTVEKIVLLNAIRLPESITASIEAKVEAKQLSLKKEEELAQATADANKKIETARGDAESMKLRADAERYAYEQKQKALTPLLVEQQWIEKWNGNLGNGNVYGAGTNIYKNISK